MWLRIQIGMKQMLYSVKTLWLRWSYGKLIVCALKNAAHQKEGDFKDEIWKCDRNRIQCVLISNVILKMDVHEMYGFISDDFLSLGRNFVSCLVSYVGYIVESVHYR